MIESQLEEMHFPEISRLIQCRIFDSRIHLVVYVKLRNLLNIQGLPVLLVPLNSVQSKYCTKDDRIFPETWNFIFVIVLRHAREMTDYNLRSEYRVISERV